MFKTLLCQSRILQAVSNTVRRYMVLDTLEILITGKFNAELLDLFHREILLKRKGKIENSQMINVLIADRKLNSHLHVCCFLI